MTVPLRIASIALAGLLTASCSVFGPQLSEDGLAKVRISGPGTLLMKPDHPAGSYDSILLVPKVGLDYATGQEPLPYYVEQAIVEHMLARLTSGARTSFPVVTTPGPCTVQLGLWLTRLSFYETRGSSSQTNFINSYGNATLVFEFRDSMTNQALIRYGQTANLGSGVEGSARGPNLDRLYRVLDVMLDNVGTRMQEALPVQMDSPSHKGCTGKLGRAVLAAREASN